MRSCLSKGLICFQLQYLEQFGYLPKVENGVAAMLSETLVEEAIRELQHYGNIPVTGKLDDATKQLMSRKRCGLPDRPINEYHHRHRRRHRKRYALSGFKWEKKTITFRFSFEIFSAQSIVSFTILLSCNVTF
ncbi:unnamed protein product [Anisakis simplex]|uniref:PG_binding_1 domain-containing protein n=1 Tax=Anisakis simplex TaxID=6269 RepID=A0A0M3KB76_ANISI|nr:unnamed protein product [Anisakis simplex]